MRNFLKYWLVPLFLVWTFGTESQRGSHPLTWYSHIVLWLRRGELPLVQTIKLRRYFQDNVFLTIIDLPIFPNIAPSTTFHVHWCELLFEQCIPNGATMINLSDKYLAVVLQLLGNSCSCSNNTCITKLWDPDLTFSIYTWVSWHCFIEHFSMFSSSF